MVRRHPLYGSASGVATEQSHTHEYNSTAKACSYSEQSMDKLCTRYFVVHYLAQIFIWLKHLILLFLHT